MLSIVKAPLFHINVFQVLYITYFHLFDVFYALCTSQVANLKDILAEKGECGVGFIANLDNKSSYGIVKDALTALGCMEHRGGCGADNDSGDGSGIMTSIPWDLLNNWANEQGIASFDQLHTGVGMMFLPKDEDLMKQAKAGQSSGRVYMISSLPMPLRQVLVS